MTKTLVVRILPNVQGCRRGWISYYTCGLAVTALDTYLNSVPAWHIEKINHHTSHITACPPTHTSHMTGCPALLRHVKELTQSSSLRDISALLLFTWAAPAPAEANLVRAGRITAGTRRQAESREPHQPSNLQEFLESCGLGCTGGFTVCTLGTASQVTLQQNHREATDYSLQGVVFYNKVFDQ